MNSTWIGQRLKGRAYSSHPPSPSLPFPRVQTSEQEDEHAQVGSGQAKTGPKDMRLSQWIEDKPDLDTEER